MKVLLGVTGGIAAYKAAEIVRALKKRGDEVRVVMTASACEFVAPLTFQVLSGNPVGTTLFDPAYEGEIGHIELARWADVLLVAPATANTIAKLAHGMADDLLTTVVSATTAPVVVAPAMNTQMYLHAPVQHNLARLRDFGWTVVDPDEGELACKEVGPGRLPDAPVILDVLARATAAGILKGRRVLVTAGPTREALDPARFLSNPSTGKMGFEIARAAWAQGATVTLVTGPTQLDTPYGVERVDVRTAQEMADSVLARAAIMDFVVKAAAVADWRPAERSEHKLAKADFDGELQMERTTDILRALAEMGATKGGPVLVGFAAESRDVEARGVDKRLRKGADVIVANEIGGPSSAFGSDSNRVCFIGPDGAEWFGPASKAAVAHELWTRIAPMGRHSGDTTHTD